MGKAAAFGLAFVGTIALFAGLLFLYVGMVTWAIVAGQYFIAAILCFIVTGFLYHRAHKSRVGHNNMRLMV